MSPGSRTSRASERPAGIEPAAPVWKTGVSAEFTRAAKGGAVVRSVRGPGRDRTADLRLAEAARYRLRYKPIGWCWAPATCAGAQHPVIVLLSSAVELRKISAAGNRRGVRTGSRSRTRIVRFWRPVLWPVELHP